MQKGKRKGEGCKVAVLGPDGGVGVLAVLEAFIMHLRMKSYDWEIYVYEVHATTLSLAVVKGPIVESNATIRDGGSCDWETFRKEPSSIYS